MSSADSIDKGHMSYEPPQFKAGTLVQSFHRNQSTEARTKDTIVIMSEIEEQEKSRESCRLLKWQVIIFLMACLRVFVISFFDYES